MMMRHDDRDEDLVRAAQHGDKGALGVLLARHRPLLLGLCRRALGDSALAEDAAQEAVLQALLSLDRVRQPARFGPWLGGIGLNVCRRCSSGRVRDLWSWEAMAGGRAGDEPPDRGLSPEEQAEAADLAAEVRRAVAALPPGQRAAVCLVYLSGLTHAETAAILGIEVGAVKTRLHKARASLRRRLWTLWREDIMVGDRVNAADRFVDVRVAEVRRPPAVEGRPRAYVVLLEELAGRRRLPIWMGEFEGTAIALHLEGVEVPRPQTFAFAAGVLHAAGGRLREVRIHKLVEEVFYAEAVVDGLNGSRAIDARPSDAINLALLAEAPIRVALALFADTTPPRSQLDEATEGTAAIAAAAGAGWQTSSCRQEREPAE